VGQSLWCRVCGVELSIGTLKCTNCGRPTSTAYVGETPSEQKAQAVESIWCRVCGSELPAHSSKCFNCGRSVIPSGRMAPGEVGYKEDGVGRQEQARPSPRPTSSKQAGTHRVNSKAPEVPKQRVLQPHEVTVGLYASLIERGEPLPTILLSVEKTTNPLLRKGEIVHFASGAGLLEFKTISREYKAGSRGLSIPLGYGVRMRLGQSKGRWNKDERYVQTSAGILILTNRRLFLQPSGVNKPVSIPLTKILSYQPFMTDGLIIYKESREKPYVFGVTDSQAIQIFTLCLDYLGR
jgi:hypothetical protein